MTSFLNQGVWHVQTCHITVIFCGHTEQGAVSVLTGVWMTGTLRVWGDLVSLNTYFSPESTAVRRPKCCWEDVIGSWLHYFVNESRKEILL